MTEDVVYGFIFMVPIAPAGVFGAIFNYSHGMTALIISLRESPSSSAH